MSLEIQPHFKFTNREELEHPPFEDSYEAVAEAMVFGYSRLVTHALLRKLRVEAVEKRKTLDERTIEPQERIKTPDEIACEAEERIQKLDEITIAALDHKCIMTSYRTSYYIWRYASELFKTNVVIHAHRRYTTGTKFTSGDGDVIESVGVFLEDMNNHYFFISPADYRGSNVWNPLKQCYHARSPIELMQKVEKGETEVAKGSVDHLFPRGDEIMELSKHCPLPHVSDVSSFVDETELQYPDYYWFGVPKYYFLDGQEAGLFRNRKNRINRAILSVPTVQRQNHHNYPFSSPTVSFYLNKMVIP